MNLNAIDPKKQGPKFSPNLFFWMRKNGKRLEEIKVYRGQNGRLYIGQWFHEDGFLHGSQLNAVLCQGSREDVWAFPLVQLGGNLEIIPNFWTEYCRDGRCAIDREHAVHFYREDDTRWKYSEDGKTRECQWCGKCVQRLEEYTYTEKRARWVRDTRGE